ncbi:histidine kinase [Paenibacillus sp. CC-CFT747]|nr:histidine kinase [Paenibacillus sp. CC-CFT747]
MAISRSGPAPAARSYSLKYRLIVMLLISSLMPLVLIGTISYSSMYAMLKNKAEAGFQSHLHQVRISLENTLAQLNHTSQQLAFDGRVGKNLEGYLIADPYQKRELREEIQSQLNLIHFTNPTLGLIFYYLGSENQTIFENFPVPSVDLSKLPKLFNFNTITYFGPHLSLNPIDGNQVLSIMRQVEIPGREDVYVYIETNFKFAESILNQSSFGSGLTHLIVDETGRIVYSDKPEDFPVGTAYADNPHFGSRGNYVRLEEKSNQSWKVIAAIPNKEYRKEINRWLGQFLLAAVLTVALSLFTAWLIWRTVYRPLNLLNLDIRRMKHSGESFSERRSRITEFAVIYREFADMRRRIHGLIGEVKQKEKSKAKLEVEKLMTQINPHFIHNTLDTVRWLARANGQKDIDRLVSMLNKVLHYNLGKTGPARIRDELEALKGYVELQGIRYNFTFDVSIQAEKEALDLPIPRFILQPLVENALYHGLGDKGVIEVDVRQEDTGHLRISVRDNGEGMTPHEISRLLGEETEEGSAK